MVMFVLTPVLILLAVLAEPVFVFLFTNKWLPAVPYFQILCVTGILFPLHSYNLTILNVKGRSDLFLKLEVIKKILIILTILVAIPFGIIALLYGQVLISFVGFFVNAHYTKRFINYTGWEQLKDVFSIFVLSVIAGVVVYILDRYGLQDQINFLRILAGGLTGMTVYFSAAYFLKFSSLSEFINLTAKK